MSQPEEKNIFILNDGYNSFTSLVYNRYMEYLFL